MPAVSLAELPLQDAEAAYEEFLQEIFDLIAIPVHDPDTFAILYDLPPDPVSGAIDLSKVPLRAAVSVGGGPNFCFMDLSDVFNCALAADNTGANMPRPRFKRWSPAAKPEPEPEPFTHVKTSTLRKGKQKGSTMAAPPKPKPKPSPKRRPRAQTTVSRVTAEMEEELRGMEAEQRMWRKESNSMVSISEVALVRSPPPATGQKKTVRLHWP